MTGRLHHSVAVSLAAACFVLAAPAGRAAAESEELAQHRAEVDAAVDRALAFLAAELRKSQAGIGRNAEAGLVGMAFLAKGYLPGQAPYGDVINLCVDRILSTADDQGFNGYLGTRGDRMYGHGIAALFLSEVSGMVDPERQKRIDAVLPQAVKVILDAQNVPKGSGYQGGWRYEPNSPDSDISVTGWQVMALRSARMNGAPVPKEAIDKAIVFIEACRGRALRLIDGAGSADDGGFWYTPPQYYANRNYWIGGPSTPARTGVALLCRELAGKHGDEMNRRAGDYLLGVTRGNGFRDMQQHEYATYYCSQGMFQLGGKYWEQFSETMYQQLLPLQQEDGSWKTSNGQIYPTAMYVLALSVSYRQLPIYQR